MTLEESYKIITDLAFHTTERSSEFNRFNMTLQVLLITGLGTLVYKHENWVFPGYLGYILPLLGMILSAIWYLGLKRFGIEADMRHAQLRALERVMSITPEQQAFTEGRRFLDGDTVTVQELLHLGSKRDLRWWGILKLYIVLSIAFMVGYLVLLGLEVILACQN